METRQLNTQEVWQIYQEKMKQDFPPSELRPYSSMEKLMKSGEYLCFGCFEGDTLAAYAYFVVSEGAALLDYYAVNESMRGQGVGGRFLSELRNFAEKFRAPSLLIEVESVSSAQNSQEAELRERRIRFYEHCGCNMTGICSMLFGVEYSIMVLPMNGTLPGDEEIKASLEKLYRVIVTPLAPSEAEYGRVCRVYHCELLKQAKELS